jgi:hypothetical protein
MVINLYIPFFMLLILIRNLLLEMYLFTENKLSRNHFVKAEACYQLNYLHNMTL